jgi:hypothetical protein
MVAPISNFGAESMIIRLGRIPAKESKLDRGRLGAFGHGATISTVTHQKLNAEAE